LPLRKLSYQWFNSGRWWSPALSSALIGIMTAEMTIIGLQKHPFMSPPKFWRSSFLSMPYAPAMDLGPVRNGEVFIREPVGKRSGSKRK